MDYDLWLKIAAKFPVAYMPKLLAHYRWLTDNKTATGGFSRLDEIATMSARHGVATPAYVQLERVNLHMQQSLRSFRSGKVGGGISNFARATGVLFSSRRVMVSMLQPKTWQVIWTGQVLRARASRMAAQV
jgi:hypothetical protein